MKKNSDNFYEHIENMLSENDIYPQNAKVQILNSHKVTLDRLEEQARKIDKVKGQPVISSIVILKQLVEDAYSISLYKFQFKMFNSSLIEEIENLRNILDYA